MIEIRLKLKGTSAFIPVEAENGKFAVRRVKYGDPLPRVVKGRLAFSDAEDLAYARNKRARIPSEIWCAIAERLKNANV